MMRASKIIGLTYTPPRIVDSAEDDKRELNKAIYQADARRLPLVLMLEYEHLNIEAQRRYTNLRRKGDRRILFTVADLRFAQWASDAQHILLLDPDGILYTVK